MNQTQNTNTSVSITEAVADIGSACYRERDRLEVVCAELLAALKGLDEAYCRAGSPLTKDERHEDRMRLIAARAAIAKATMAQP